MLPRPANAPAIGAYEELGSPPQDPTGAVINELRTSMLDTGTALRLGWVGRRVYFGTEMAPLQIFTRPPSDINAPDSIRAGVMQTGNARRTEGKTASRGRRARLEDFTNG